MSERKDDKSNKEYLDKLYADFLADKEANERYKKDKKHDS